MVQNQTANWEDVRLFLALSRHKSARAAANALRISHTTIARRVDQLERSLETRLFDRDVRGYRLTAAGETLLGSAEAAEESLLEAERRLHGRDALLAGRISLTTPDLVATHFLMADLVAFTDQYPDIELSVLSSYDLFDLGRREADVAIRMLRPGAPAPPDLIGRKLATGSSAYYASPNYLRRHPQLSVGDGACWIGWDDDVSHPDWVRASIYPDLPVRGQLNNVLLQVEAARQGMGLAVLPCFVADQTEGLVRIPGSTPYPNYDIWLLSHPDLREAARLRAFRTFIVEVFEEKRALMTGLPIATS